MNRFKNGKHGTNVQETTSQEGEVNRTQADVNNRARTLRTGPAFRQFLNPAVPLQKITKAKFASIWDYFKKIYVRYEAEFLFGFRLCPKCLVWSRRVVNSHDFESVFGIHGPIGDNEAAFKNYVSWYDRYVPAGFHHAPFCFRIEYSVKPHHCEPTLSMALAGRDPTNPPMDFSQLVPAGVDPGRFHSVMAAIVATTSTTVTKPKDPNRTNISFTIDRDKLEARLGTGIPSEQAITDWILKTVLHTERYRPHVLFMWALVILDNFNTAPEVLKQYLSGPRAVCDPNPMDFHIPYPADRPPHFESAEPSSPHKNPTDEQGAHSPVDAPPSQHHSESSSDETSTNSQLSGTRTCSKAKVDSSTDSVVKRAANHIAKLKFGNCFQAPQMAKASKQRKSTPKYASKSTSCSAKSPISIPVDDEVFLDEASLNFAPDAFDEHDSSSIVISGDEESSIDSPSCKQVASKAAPGSLEPHGRPEEVSGIKEAEDAPDVRSPLVLPWVAECELISSNSLDSTTSKYERHELDVAYFAQSPEIELDSSLKSSATTEEEPIAPGGKYRGGPAWRIQPLLHRSLRDGPRASDPYDSAKNLLREPRRPGPKPKKDMNMTETKNKAGTSITLPGRTGPTAIKAMLGKRLAN